jgi:hypothetical protein
MIHQLVVKSLAKLLLVPLSAFEAEEEKSSDFQESNNKLNETIAAGVKEV